jgi:Uma2 family endonuclease
MPSVPYMTSTRIPPEIVRPSALEPDGHYEVINGQIVEKPPMGAYEVWMASHLFGFLVKSEAVQNLGLVVSEMLFLLDPVEDINRRPDLAFVSWDRWPQHRPVPKVSAWEVIPDLAIEVISPSNLASAVIVKVGEYFKYGVRRVWVIYPIEEQVYIYETPKRVQILTRSDRMDEAMILPGFELALGQLFRREAEPAEA